MITMVLNQLGRMILQLPHPKFEKLTQQTLTLIHMGVEPKIGFFTSKSSHLFIGFSIINSPFWGTIIFGNTHILQALSEKWGKFSLPDIVLEKMTGIPTIHCQVLC